MLDESTAQAVFDHAGLSVSDLDEAREFYGELFGFNIVEDDFHLPEGEVHGLVLRNATGVRLELFHRPGTALPEAVGSVTPEPGVSSRSQGWFQFALTVPDLDASYAAVTAQGAKPVLEPRFAPDGITRVGFVCDPDGNLVELLQRYDAPTA